MELSNGAALVLRLRGGLGNQFFQYAAARSLALRNRVPLLLDDASGFREDPYGRRYELGAFKTIDARVDPAAPMTFGFLSTLRRIYLRAREYTRMRFKGSYFDPFICKLSISRPVLFESYCQSFRYFNDIENLVRQEFEFKTVPNGLDQEMVSAIVCLNSVCLHARRLHGITADGSAPSSVTQYYGACGLDYYRRSILELAALHGHLQIFVFSDNIQWAQQNLDALQSEYGDVRVLSETDTLRSFYLMRLCKHFIIANSSYSWWAAWLGKDSKKTVCVPSVWNSGERRFPQDLFPVDWKVISPDLEVDGEGLRAGPVRPQIKQ